MQLPGKRRPLGSVHRGVAASIRLEVHAVYAATLRTCWNTAKRELFPGSKTRLDRWKKVLGQVYGQVHPRAAKCLHAGDDKLTLKKKCIDAK